jgi:NADPH:quinone reductase-like Zn-dependent oxidoreductase
MESMKAVRIHDFGGADVLREESLPVPQPGNDELLVKVCAASINPVDYKIRKGGYIGPEQLPVTMGRDISGTIEILGADVRDFGKGDAVYAMLGRDRGGYAEYVIVKPGEFAAKPAKLDHVRAAAVPLAAMTAWQGLFDQGGLAAGQRVLIHGGAGGVGHMAVQFAKAKGAWVATTVSKSDLGFARDLGADRAIDHRNEDFSEELHDLDLVFDLIGGETQKRSIKVLKDGGTLISTVDLADGLGKEKHIRTAHYMAVPNSGQLVEVARLIDEGKVRVVVDAVFLLADAARAQEMLEKEHIRGKVVLEVSADSAGKLRTAAE